MDPQSLMKKALIELRDMRGRLDSMEYRQREPIAIIGLGCRLPGGVTGANNYWKMLESGTDAITEVPASRWDIDDYYSADPNAPGKMSCRYGGFLDAVDTFDAQLFGISPKETVHIDPQHRILLEVTWEALENASIAADDVYGSNTGVFVGISGFEYGALQFVAEDARKINAYSAVGSGLCAASGRLSYTFGFTGPCMSVDTACSSSLVAVHLACQSLRGGECDMGIAAGVNLILIPAPNIIFSRAGMLSPDGRCKTFDADANGYVRGEGCGVVVLKRLSDAIADGDNVLAVVRGSAVNQDGPSGGLTVPSGPAQERVIQSALLNAAVEVSDVSYIEAHGTGTSLGDPIEVGALGAVFKAVKTKAAPLVIGSVKTNFGHLEAAAGVAGLIKVVLSMRHGTIPPHLHFKSPNPHIDWENLPIEVASEGRAWHGKKIAGVSSFGFSGTNAHVVLEEAPVSKPVEAEFRRPVHILTLSAKTEEALKELTGRYKEMLSSDSDISVSDICNTSNVGRSHFNKRGFAIGATVEELLNGLSDVSTSQLPEGHPKVAFLFTGQGGLSADMGRGLYESSPVFRDTILKCDTILRRHMKLPLLELMYGGTSAGVLNETRYAQPVLFSLEYSLYELWRSWGIAPGAVIGHSIGEYTAACVAGVFYSPEDALMLVAERGRLMWEAPGDGAMAAVFAGETLVQEFLSENVSIAAVNGPDSVVISGQRDSVKNVCVRLTERGIKHKELQVSHGFHSKLMDPVLDKFAGMASRVTYNKGIIPVVSNVTGEYYRGAELCADYWVRHLRAAVRFSDGIETLYKDGYRIFLELGPNAVLLGMGSRCVEGAAWLPSLRAGQDDWRQLLKSLGAIYIRGMDINWKALNAPYGYKKATLPTYPFARKRYWIDIKQTKSNTTEALAPDSEHSIAGRRISLSTGDIVFENTLSYESPDFIKQHRIYGVAVVPAAVFIELALSAGKYLTNAETITLRNFKIFQPLAISENGSRVKLQTLITPEKEKNSFFIFKISSRLENGDDNTPWVFHVTGTISVGGFDVIKDLESLSSVKSRCTKELEVSDIYRQFSSRGLEYGPDFQAVQKIWAGDDEALGLIILSDSASLSVNTHPIAIDAALQTAFVLINNATSDNFLPVAIGSLNTTLRPVTKLWSWARTIQKTDNEIIINFTIYGDDGSPIMFLEGLTAKKADRTTLLGVADPADFLYGTVWERKDLEAGQTTGITDIPVQGDQWVVFTDGDALGIELSSYFKENGLESILVRQGEAYRELPGGGGFEINPQSAGDYEKLFSTFQRLRGVVSLWSAALSNPDGVIALLYTAQALIKYGKARLMTVTRGVVVGHVGENAGIDINVTGLLQSPVWGFGRVLSLEHPELDSILVDLTAIPQQGEALFLYYELFRGDKERQVALRDGTRYCCRLKRLTPKQFSAAAAPEAENVALRLSEYGRMDALSLEPVSRVSPSENEVEIEVKAAGLNFRDVLNALGMLREFSGDKAAKDVDFGFECAGVVSRIGSNVRDIKPGDKVIVVPVSGTFSAYTTVNSNFVSPMPQNMSRNEAATIPLAYLTAWYGLIVLGKLRAGHSIVIHAAAGGVGLAAVNIAKMVGATIYATASRGKWDFLRGEGVEHIMDSRTLDFSDEVMALTGGRGVDVVLNSLNGEYIPKGLNVLSEGGRFIEIGKIGIWTEEEVRQLRPDVSYHSFDMGEVSKKDPSVIKEILGDITSHVSSGELSPLFHKVFPVTDAEAAFRYMAAAKHVGKVVIEMGNITGNLKREIIRADATYIITGGLGALGLELSSWLVKKGARHIALTGRSGAAVEAQQRISQLQSEGASVAVISADVSVAEDVGRLFSAIDETMPPVRGIFHAAGVLADGVIINQDADKFRRVMAPKVNGIWNLYNNIKNREIDFFVLFSSAASVFGSAGQANYASANAFLDSAANYITSRGIRAIAIGWGSWAGAGMSAGIPERDKSGFNKIEIRDALIILENLIRGTHTNACVVDINWRTYLSRLPYNAIFESFYSETSDAAHTLHDKSVPESDILKKIRAASPEDGIEVIVSYIKTTVQKILGSDGSLQISMDEPLMDQGFDSLMSVEFRNIISKELDIELHVGFLFNYPTVRVISDYLKDELVEKNVPAKKDEEAAAKDAGNLDFIDDLNDDELEKLIRKDLGDNNIVFD